MTYGDVVYNQLYGFVNATLGFTSNSQEQCLETIESFHKNMTVTLPDLYEQKKYKQFSATFANMLRNVDPTTKSCIWSADDGYDIYFPNGTTLEDFKRVVYNVIYRFGNIFDRLYELNVIFKYKIVAPFISNVEW
jgi:hypothetical protein